MMGCAGLVSSSMVFLVQFSNRVDGIVINPRQLLFPILYSRFSSLTFRAFAFCYVAAISAIDISTVHAFKTEGELKMISAGDAERAMTFLVVLIDEPELGSRAVA